MTAKTLLLFSFLAAATGPIHLRAEPGDADHRADDDCCRAGSGAIYLMTNQASNAVMVFNRSEDGTLAKAGMFLTGGSGGQVPGGNPFDPLQSQNSLILSQEGHFLFAVNAGSNEISAFGVDSSGLTLLDKVPSGGQTPVSLTLYRDVLYVLNAGGIPNITGFRISRDGKLAVLSGSTQPLSGGAAAQPAQVGFSPDGDLLVVTEKMTNIIDTYRVTHDGRATAPVQHSSNGMTPFGFAFVRPEVLIDSEAFGGAPQQAAVSSYQLSETGDLQVLSGSVPDHQTAACWVVISHRGRFAYVTNTGSFIISGYSISGEGTLSLLNSNGVAADTGANTNPIDMVVTGQFLYTHLAGPNGRRIVGYRIESNGALTKVADVNGLPAGAQGISGR